MPGGGFQIATAYVDVEARLDKGSATAAATKAGEEAGSGFGKGFQSTGAKMKSVGSDMTKWVTLPLVGLGAMFTSELMQADEALGQTEAAIKSTGGAAGQSVDDILAMSGSLSELSSFDDEAIQSGANTLLTFTKVAGENFEPAMLQILNLSARFGTDIQSSSIMVGKALNDPIKGLTTLGKAGITFSQDQKAAIAALVETGDVAGAQTLILGELETQVGGSAEAYGSGLAGKLRTVKNDFLEVGASIVETMIPALEAGAGVATTVMGAFTRLPGPIKALIGVFAAVAAAMGPLLWIGGSLAVKFRELSGAWKAFKALNIGSTLATMVSGFATAHPYVTAFVIAVTALAAAWAIASTASDDFSDHVDDIKDSMIDLIDSGMSAEDAMKSWMKEEIDPEFAATLADLGITIDEIVAAATEGGDAWVRMSNRIANANPGAAAFLDELALKVPELVEHAADMEAIDPGAGMEESLEGATTAADEAATAIDKVNTAIDEYLGLVQDRRGALVAMEGAEDAFTESLREAPRNFNASTVAGRENIEMGDAWVASAADRIKANNDWVAAGGNATVAQRRNNQVLREGRTQLRNWYDQGLINEGQYHRMKKDLDGLPTEVETELSVAGVENTHRDVDRAETYARKGWGNRRFVAQLRADWDAVQAAYDNATRLGTDWQSRRYAAVFDATGAPGSHRASGGPVEAGRAYIVGERRAEMFVPDADGTIVPRVPRAASGGGGSAGVGGNIYVNTIEIPARDLAEMRDVADFFNRIEQTARTGGVTAIAGRR